MPRRGTRRSNRRQVGEIILGLIGHCDPLPVIYSFIFVQTYWNGTWIAVGACGVRTFSFGYSGQGICVLVMSARPVLYFIVICFYNTNPADNQAFWFLEVTKPYQRCMISPYKELLSKKKVFEVFHECDYG